jgi:hypothetical protein
MILRPILLRKAENQEAGNNRGDNGPVDANL